MLNIRKLPIGRWLFLLMFYVMSCPAIASATETMVGGAPLKPWWFWPVILFFFCLILGILAVMAGVGGGVLYVPLVSGFWSLLVVACLLGLANGIGTGIVMIIGADLSRRSEDRSQFLGVWRLMGDIGMSGAPLMTAALVTVASLGAASVFLQAPVPAHRRGLEGAVDHFAA